MSKTTLNLPEPGPHRYWEVKHQPQKKNTPVRIELRERTNKHSPRFIQSWTRLIAFDDTVAVAEMLHETAAKILDRASRVDEFVGIHGIDPDTDMEEAA